DEKLNKGKQSEQSNSIKLTQESSMTVMSVLRERKLLSGSFCGGRGDCGRCLVQFLAGAPLPTGIERSCLEPEELRQGFRLACVTRPKTDCVIRIPEQDVQEIPIVTELNPVSQNIDLNGQQNKLSENQISFAMKISESTAEAARNLNKNVSVISRRKAGVMIAVDLGTTTIAMQLRDMASGEVIDTYCELNPQRPYGADVLSRIQASCDGHREVLRRLVCETLMRGLRQFAVSPVCMCIAGNTTMEHLLLGYDVSTLGRSPFTPVEIGLQEMMTSRLFTKSEGVAEEADEASLPAGWDFPVYIAPGISAFVGGDIVAGLYTLQMLPGIFAPCQRDVKAEAGKQESVTLLIDLGTNGEIAITDGKRMLVTATAAGPAFEGGRNSALIGTDRIALTADLLRQGKMDETGFLAEANNRNEHYLNQKDIRDLQMAKAAIRAGVEILWEKMGCPEIGMVYLAGGFGYHLDVEAALVIGLLPERLRGRIQSVGNTALEGAYRLGRDLTAGDLMKSRLEEALAVTESGSLHAVNLAKQEGFERLYIQYMNLERN
ncbi:MAG: ASKHA domain-containing protein, partial [Lachnospiraceae bacterium]|nr:ASKHA domain-containing protein [Lachnospiraceae bacterium]